MTVYIFAGLPAYSRRQPNSVVVDHGLWHLQERTRVGFRGFGIGLRRRWQRRQVVQEGYTFQNHAMEARHGDDAVAELEPLLRNGARRHSA